MNNYADNESVQMYKWSCASCGCIMCMTDNFNNKLRESHQTFYCVNGHANIYNKKTNIEDIEAKLMNEYAKNAQLEEKIKELNKSLINRIFTPKK